VYADRANPHLGGDLCVFVELPVFVHPQDAADLRLLAYRGVNQSAANRLKLFQQRCGRLRSRLRRLISR
jgi:hypothetical protein